MRFAEIVLPLAVRKTFTYAVPSEIEDELLEGMRVEVEMNRKHYAGLVVKLHGVTPEGYVAKPILAVLDEQPSVNPHQIKLWQWMASYYLCTQGEVMYAALPSGLKLSSETKVVLNPAMETEEIGFHVSERSRDKADMVIEALRNRGEMTLQEIQKLLGQKTVIPLLTNLLQQKVVFLFEEMKEKFRPRKYQFVRFTEPYRKDPASIRNAFDMLPSNAERQMETLMALIQLQREFAQVRLRDLCQKADAATSVVHKLAEKGIMEVYEREVSRLDYKDDDDSGNTDGYELSEEQSTALKSLKAQFNEKQVALLHGVTGSGKTQVYLKMLEETLAQGKQALYLLPEISLTAQMVSRLRKQLGKKVLVYHSRLNENERIEIWNAVRTGASVVVGARSALFLPYLSLGLVIVDEEHDGSYKQSDPAPRYQGRDTAIYLAGIHGAKTILGTATPSLETWYNVKTAKYGYARLDGRFGGTMMPEVEVIDLKPEYKTRRMQAHFSERLLEELKTTIANEEQAILFQNRRGYAPVLTCKTCAWTCMCKHCDVNLTYHKYSHEMRCHYCGYKENLPRECPACASYEMNLQGLGTEKVEDDLKIYLPDARVARMDWDTVRGKNAFDKLMEKFEERELDLLVGTQMVTKGLDFEHVGMVGVINADSLLYYPDFRAGERAFQMLTQVSGRAGRRKKRGKVIIQTSNPKHPVIVDVVGHDFQKFAARELAERSKFGYPPFIRLIHISLRHKDKDRVNKASAAVGKILKHGLGERLLGPAEPAASRLKGFYIMDMMLKLEKSPKVILAAKEYIDFALEMLAKNKEFSGVKMVIDVDP